MLTLALATTAVMASTVAALGSAVVTNGCTYDVYMSNVPAADGGYEAISQWLSPNETYTQQWTGLTNKCGWSIKLSKSSDLSTPMQYEYTYHPGTDEPLWFDLSDVDGNPWNGNWMITSNNLTECAPRHAAYRNSTDDAYGMQSCPTDSTISVTLCSDESQEDGVASSVSASVASLTSTASASTYAATLTVAPTTAATSTYVAPSSVASSSAAKSSVASTAAASSSTSKYRSHTSRHGYNVVATSISQPTTLITQSTTAVASTVAPGVTVTNVETVVVTEVATATAYAKRDEHAHHHVHHPHMARA